MAKDHGIATRAITAVNKASIFAVLGAMIFVGEQWSGVKTMKSDIADLKKQTAELKIEVVRTREKLDAWIDWCEQ